MPRDPGSVWAPLPEAGAPDGYAKTQFIVHSTGDNGTAAATRRYFAGVTPNESTFIVGWGPQDPTLQIMDSTDNADANGSANQRGISVEVVGDGSGGYNAWQRSELIRLGIWARNTHGILPRIIPSEPAGGFGWHVMFGAPGPWAKVAKSCPGARRIQELKADIFPAIFAGQSALPATPPVDPRGPEMRLVQVKDSDPARNGRIYKVTDMEVTYISDPEVAGAHARMWGDPMEVTQRQVDVASYDANVCRASQRREIVAGVVAQVSGVDVDEEALGRVVVEGMLPELTAALAEKTGATREDVEQIVRGAFRAAATA